MIPDRGKEDHLNFRRAMAGMELGFNESVKKVKAIHRAHKGIAVADIKAKSLREERRGEVFQV